MRYTRPMAHEETRDRAALAAVLLLIVAIGVVGLALSAALVH